MAGLAGKREPELPELRRQGGVQDWLRLGVDISYGSLFVSMSRGLRVDQLCSAAAPAVGAAPALDFLKLLTMIVISGTSTIGSTLFRG